MYKFMLPLCIFGLLSTCNEKQDLRANLLGKWEADYVVNLDLDTTFFQQGTNSPCAYIVLPGEYNSGFEIIDQAKGELIWCGGNKGQFFAWSLTENLMTIQWAENKASVTIESLTDSTMVITVGESGNKFKMKKY